MNRFVAALAVVLGVAVAQAAALHDARIVSLYGTPSTLRGSSADELSGLKAAFDRHVIVAFRNPRDNEISAVLVPNGIRGIFDPSNVELQALREFMYSDAPKTALTLNSARYLNIPEMSLPMRKLRLATGNLDTRFLFDQEKQQYPIILFVNKDSIRTGNDLLGQLTRLGDFSYDKDHVKIVNDFSIPLNDHEILKTVHGGKHIIPTFSEKDLVTSYINPIRRYANPIYGKDTVTKYSNPIFGERDFVRKYIHPIYGEKDLISKYIPVYGEKDIMTKYINPIYGEKDLISKYTNPIYGEKDIYPIYGEKDIMTKYINPIYGEKDLISKYTNPIYGEKDIMTKYINPIYGEKDLFSKYTNPIYGEKDIYPIYGERDIMTKYINPIYGEKDFVPKYIHPIHGEKDIMTKYINPIYAEKDLYSKYLDPIYSEKDLATKYIKPIYSEKDVTHKFINPIFSEKDLVGEFL